ncbi:MAG: glycoside hydrolase family 75 protein [Chthoniobacteraceae bacterium]
MNRAWRIVLCGAFAFALAGCPRPVPPEPKPTPAPTPEPKPTPTPPPYVPAKRIEFGKVFNGMQYKVTLETEHGTTAAKDRTDPASYTAEVTVKVKVPKPHKELAEITALSPKLPELLPQLPQLLERANVSPFFDDLYRLKVEHTQSRLYRLDVLLSRANFYDTETILELQHPETKRRALLVQADMDVDEDGSDPERVPFVDGSSLTFQPFTSYNWRRKTDAPNPFLAGREQSLDNAKRDLAVPGLSADKTKSLKTQIEDLKAEVHSLKTFSFLVGAIDPFIVLPLCVVGKKSDFSPRTGDYCVVVHDGTLFPAIVGDVGPTYKMGEASMRICKEINARSSSINAATSDLKITYLVFPGSGDRPFAAPDLAKWREQCAKLLAELGGATGELFAWKDLTTPPPPPATPAPSAATPTPVPAQK